MSETDGPPTVVVGLDGACWDLIGDWVRSGELPTLARLVETGIGGPSRSCLPPLTVPNWACYATGKNPGKLDVFRFDRVDTDARELTFHDATDVRSARLWDYLAAAGHRVGVLNVPTTYPPEPIDGFVVAGGPDASESAYRSLRRGFATPPDVERYLAEELDYRVHPSPMISPGETDPAEVEAVLDLIERRFEAAERLLERERPDFLHLTVFYNMALQHYFADGEPTRRAWQAIDRGLARFVDDDRDLVVVSDHGTRPVEAVLYANAFLAEAGYLAVDGGLDRWLRRVGVTRERALAAAKRVGATDLLARVVPDRLQRVVPWEEGIKRDRVLSAVDWERTRAVASTQGPVYLTLDRGDPGYEALRDELADRLPSVVHPETGRNLVTAVHRGERYYDGPYAGNAPDLIVEAADGVHVSDALGPDRPVADEGVWAGGNHPEGLFLCRGPSFRAEGLSARAEIVDLAPTILHAMGVPVPDDLDGEVLDVFDPDSAAGRRPVRTGDPLPPRHGAGADGDRGVEDRLADLGYLE